MSLRGHRGSDDSMLHKSSDRIRRPGSEKVSVVCHPVHGVSTAAGANAYGDGVMGSKLCPWYQAWPWSSSRTGRGREHGNREAIPPASVWSALDSLL